MQECTRTKTKTVNLGRLPVYCGYFMGDGPEDHYDPNIGYHKYNIVTYKGSSFINLVEGNKKEPFIIKSDGKYYFEDNEGQWSGWYVVANALDAYYWAKQAENNFFSLEFNQNTGDFVGYYGTDGYIENLFTDYITGDMWLDVKGDVSNAVPV